MGAAPSVWRGVCCNCAGGARRSPLDVGACGGRALARTVRMGDQASGASSAGRRRDTWFRRGRRRRGEPTLHPLAVPYTAFAFASGYSLGPTLEELREDPGAAARPRYWPILIGIGLAFGVPLLVGIWRGGGGPGRGLLVAPALSTLLFTIWLAAANMKPFMPLLGCCCRRSWPRGARDVATAASLGYGGDRRRAAARSRLVLELSLRAALRARGAYVAAYLQTTRFCKSRSPVRCATTTTSSAAPRASAGGGGSQRDGAGYLDETVPGRNVVWYLGAGRRGSTRVTSWVDAERGRVLGGDRLHWDPGASLRNGSRRPRFVARAGPALIVSNRSKRARSLVPDRLSGPSKSSNHSPSPPAAPPWSSHLKDLF